MFEDRRDAGRQLAGHLARFAALEPVVVALPRGGVPVAAEIADRLSARLDIVVVRKLGCPGQPELGIGAIAEGGVRVVNDDLVRNLAIGPSDLEAVTTREARELERRVRRYRGDQAAFPLDGRVVILVDDGLATGFTMRAAVESVRRRGASRVILAIPVAPTGAIAALRDVADDIEVVETPRSFSGVGLHYRDFRQTSDEQVVAILEGAARPGRALRRALSQGLQTPPESTETRPR